MDHSVMSFLHIVPENVDVKGLIFSSRFTENLDTPIPDKLKVRTAVGDFMIDLRITRKNRVQLYGGNLTNYLCALRINPHDVIQFEVAGAYCVNSINFGPDGVEKFPTNRKGFEGLHYLHTCDEQSRYFLTMHSRCFYGTDIGERPVLTTEGQYSTIKFCDWITSGDNVVAVGGEEWEGIYRLLRLRNGCRVVVTVCRAGKFCVEGYGRKLFKTRNLIDESDNSSDDDNVPVGFQNINSLYIQPIVEPEAELTELLLTPPLSFQQKLQDHTLRNGRLTIPHDFVDRHDLQRYNDHDVTIWFRDSFTVMKILVVPDARLPPGTINRHVIIRGDWRTFARYHGLQRGKIMHFTIDALRMAGMGPLYLFGY